MKIASKGSDPLKSGWAILGTVVSGVIACGIGSFIVAAFVAGGVYAVVGDVGYSAQDTLFTAWTLGALAWGVYVAIVALDGEIIRLCGRDGVAYVWRPIAAFLIGLGAMMVYVDWASMFTPDGLPVIGYALRVAYGCFFVVLVGQWIAASVIARIERHRLVSAQTWEPENGDEDEFAW